jgi:hypothetical protein
MEVFLLITGDSNSRPTGTRSSTLCVSYVVGVGRNSRSVISESPLKRLAIQRIHKDA